MKKIVSLFLVLMLLVSPLKSAFVDGKSEANGKSAKTQTTKKG